MSFADFLWLGFWFLAGLGTFQIRGIKRLAETIAAAITAFSFILLLGSKADPIVSFVQSWPIDFISGFLTHMAYLIGANVSRYMQFGTISLPRITLCTIYLLVAIILRSWIAEDWNPSL